MPRPRGWSDDDLRRALDGATTLRQVVERLQLGHGGASYTTVRTRLEVLGLTPPAAPPTGGAVQPAWRRRFSDDELRAAVASSRSLHGVFRALGMQVGGSQWATIRGLIEARGWSTDHWDAPLPGGRQASPDLEAFRAALAEADLPALVARASSRADVIRALGHAPRSGLYRVLRRAILAAAIDTSHLDARHAAVQRAPGVRKRRPIEELLVRGSHLNTHTLKLRLIEEGLLDPRCARCELTTWLDGPVPLELDHVDGDRTNNELPNLRLLCPNCHALTDTYRGRNIGRGGRRG